MNTTKTSVRLISEICRQRGIRKVIFSPGSRSAPIVIAFSQIKTIECIVIPDERVAGYFALGMSQQLRETVAVVCTSGTAVLNLFPAVCEAKHQRISLLVITADRPKGAMARGENQAIDQQNIFGKYAISCSFNGERDNKNSLNRQARRLTQALDTIQYPNGGVIHLNLRLSEPLYDTTDEKIPHIQIPPVIFYAPPPLRKSDSKRIRKMFGLPGKKMIIVGMHEYDLEFSRALEILSRRKDLVILKENISNLDNVRAIWNGDSCISLAESLHADQFIPDLVITLGGPIISKKIRKFLHRKPKLHWDVPAGGKGTGGRKMFGKRPDRINPLSERQFLEILTEAGEMKGSSFQKDWYLLSKKAEKLFNQYCGKIEFSDLKAFVEIVRSFPANANIQYGNSSPVRYSNLIPHRGSLSFHANRGTSGIDGCLSTAAGAAYVHEGLTVCVLGDMSFFYDSNALWNNYLSPDFRIIIINNSGGNIFRWIEGATELTDFEKFFETRHHLSASHLASMYDIPYYLCSEDKELRKILKTFYDASDKPKILELKTDGVLSARVYKDYFVFLKTSENQRAGQV